MKLKVALLAGGDSSEREISLGSARMVEKAFDSYKYDVRVVDVHGRDWAWVDSSGVRHAVDRNDFSVMVDGERHVFDYAFIMIHGTPGEDGRLQGYLDMMGVPYSSSGFLACVATFDKNLCKLLVEGIEGLNLAKSVFIRKGEMVDAAALAQELGLPMFIKPNASGSSCGVTKVKRAEDIPAAIAHAFEEGEAVLAESFVQGREFGCGVMLTAERELLLPVTEIVPKNDFFDYEAKYTVGLSDELTPAPIPEELSGRLQRLALAAYRRCGCRGIARVDFIVDSADRAWMIEINSIPGMSAGSIVPKQLASAGITMTKLLDMIIEDTK